LRLRGLKQEEGLRNQFFSFQTLKGQSDKLV
jgi:hypothetical protein